MLSTAVLAVVLALNFLKEKKPQQAHASPLTVGTSIYVVLELLPPQQHPIPEGPDVNKSSSSFLLLLYSQCAGQQSLQGS